MKVEGQLYALGASRNTVARKDGNGSVTYCDLYAAGAQQEGADRVGMLSERYRMDPKLVDTMRHMKLPGYVQYGGILERYGKELSLTITDLKPIAAPQPTVVPPK